MGSAWHTREEGGKREWVLYASGIVALLVLAGIGAGIAVATGAAKRSAQGSDSSGSSTPTAVVSAIARPPPANVAEQSVAAPPPPATAQAARPPPPRPASPPPSPSQSSPQPPPPPRKSPPPPPPTTPKPPPPPPSTYDPSYIAAATGNSVPPAPGFVPVVVNASFEGTCALRSGMQYLCNDGMTGTVDQTDYTLLKLMHDPTQMEACGFADMGQIANSLAGWAYASQCGVEAFTVVRACVGIPGGAGQGHWRARVMLWPKAGSTNPACIPMCLKLRGNANTLTDYGRHGSCNAQTA